MRKVPSNLENPLDDALLYIVEACEPALARTCISPNHLTLFSIMCKAWSAWGLRARRYRHFLLATFLAVALDYADGHHARSTGAVTRVGDVMDHASDALHVIALLCIASRGVRPRQRAPWLAVVALSATASWVHLGCQQLYHEAHADTTQELLGGLTLVCPSWQWMVVTRYFGTGSFYVVLGLVCRGLRKMSKQA